ncbi:MFS transporter [Actinoplanes solisilvae]|uniref:MFS transporter n=1 Tax=Actinoplanes solisilvae TaxID=2486853 RepID=UPI0013E370F8|nr:MFS transporter [Actinoplanes solisilvae]
MKNATPALAAIGLGTLATALAQTTVLPALPALASALHTDRQSVTWTLTAYLIASAVFTPVIGRLGDLFGRRRLLIAILIVFAAGSVLSAVSDNLGLVLAGRVLQGAGGGIIPLGVAVARSAFPAERRAHAIGIISAIFGVGTGLGLVLGGLIVDHTSYTWIFWITAVLAAGSGLAVALALPSDEARPAGGRLDLAGALLLGLGVTLPLLAVSRGNEWGWTSGRTLVLLFAGLAVLVLFGLVERRTASPLADLRLLTRPAVLVTNITTFLVGIGMFGAFVLVPQLAQAPVSTGYGFGVDATRAGLLLAPGSLAMMAGGPIAAILHKRYGGRPTLAAAAGITALGMALLGVWHGNQVLVLAWSFVALVGVGLALAIIPTMIVGEVPAERAAEAAGVNALVRSVGSSVGTQILAGILAAGAVTHERNFTIAFLFSAAATVIAMVAATLIPRASATLRA